MALKEATQDNRLVVRLGFALTCGHTAKRLLTQAELNSKDGHIMFARCPVCQTGGVYRAVRFWLESGE